MQTLTMLEERYAEGYSKGYAEGKAGGRAEAIAEYNKNFERVIVKMLKCEESADIADAVKKMALEMGLSKLQLAELLTKNGVASMLEIRFLEGYAKGVAERNAKYERAITKMLQIKEPIDEVRKWALDLGISAERFTELLNESGVI